MCNKHVTEGINVEAWAWGVLCHGTRTKQFRREQFEGMPAGGEGSREGGTKAGRAERMEQILYLAEGNLARGDKSARVQPCCRCQQRAAG